MSEPSRAQELKVIADFYDLMLYLVGRIEKFPRHHRYTLGASMETRLQTILTLLLRAKYTRERNDFLESANIELEVLRFQLRLAKDLKALAINSHGHASGLIIPIGAQIGGWLRSSKGRTE